MSYLGDTVWFANNVHNHIYIFLREKVPPCTAFSWLLEEVGLDPSVRPIPMGHNLLPPHL